MNSTTFQFHSRMQVSFRNYSTREYSPRKNQRLYLYFPDFFISFVSEERDELTVKLYIYISRKYLCMCVYLYTGDIKN